MAGWGGLIPVVILFIVVGAAGFIGYSIYQWSNELADRGRRKLEKKNMSFTKDGGLRVGVKELKDETYADKTQSILVNVWNHASLPNYKSRLGWNKTQTFDPKKGDSRPSMSRHASSQNPVRTGGASSSTSATATGRSKPSTPPVQQQQQQTNRKSPSTAPGGWD